MSLFFYLQRRRLSRLEANLYTLGGRNGSCSGSILLSHIVMGAVVVVVRRRCGCMFNCFSD